MAICPSFLLAGVLEATADSTLAVVMTVGTIVFANGFLYAGLASFGYFLATVFFSKQRARRSAIENSQSAGGEARIRDQL